MLTEKIRLFDHEKLDAYQAALDFDLIEEERYFKGREILIRIVSMLIKMAQISN